jgi:hypothetical protein
MGRAKTAAELVAEAERLVAVVRRGNILPEDRAAIVNAVVVDMRAAYDQVRLKIICDSLAAAINALKQRP